MKLIFDIETVRQFETLEHCPEPTLAAWQNFSRKKWPEEDAKQTYMNKAALFPEFGKIVVISCLDSESKKITSLNGLGTEIKTPEFVILKTFKDRINIQGDWSGCTFIGHYVKGFDTPYIVTRMIANNIEIPDCLKFYGRKPWEITNVIDTREVWKQGQYTTCNASSLECVCLSMGIESPKQNMSGEDVGFIYYMKDMEIAIQEITEYCEDDVRATKDVFNKMYKRNMV